MATSPPLGGCSGALLSPLGLAGDGGSVEDRGEEGGGGKGGEDGGGATMEGGASDNTPVLVGTPDSGGGTSGDSDEGTLQQGT